MQKNYDYFQTVIPNTPPVYHWWAKQTAPSKLTLLAGLDAQTNSNITILPQSHNVYTSQGTQPSSGPIFVSKQSAAFKHWYYKNAHLCSKAEFSLHISALIIQII